MSARIREIPVGWLLALAAPVLLFAFVRIYPPADVSFGSGTSHFYVVTAVAALALVLATAVLVTARRLPAARTLFLAMAFLSMATIFLAHGLGTSPYFGGPGGVHTTVTHNSSYGAQSIGPTTFGNPGDGGTTAFDPGPGETFFARLKVVGYSAQLSLLVSAAFFFLAVIDIPDQLSAWISRRQYWIAAGLIAGLGGHVYFALWHPQALAPLPLDNPWVARSAATIATAGLLFAALRFYQAYRLALLPIQGALAIAVVLLAEAQWSMQLGELWHLSWWEYHFLMLGGFLIGVIGLLHNYRITGDLGAIVEGLFLRQQVNGIREGDPRAMIALGAAVAAKDSETSEHIERVGDLSVAVGGKLWLPPDDLLVLRWAGRLHDVGKIGVPNSILRKPAKLTPAEFEVIERHTVRGFEIARRSGLLAEAAGIIRSHHEKLDGSGYPDGLVGDQITMQARIVAVADIWDALTSDRPYRAGMSPQEAAEILLEETGQRLDPAAVEALLTTLGLPNFARQVDIAARRLSAAA
ncbi:MAG: HD-GYP domain-containing protein [Dehalococcoidia bacterium]